MNKTCPQCSAEMALNTVVTTVATVGEGWAESTAEMMWVCPQCGLEQAVGADVEAQLEERPRLL